MHAPRTVLLLALITATAEGQGLQRLLDNSPFGGTRPTTEASAEPAGPLEFRGVAHEDNVLWFSLFDTVTKRSLWVAQNAGGPGPIVRSFDAATQTITVEQNAQTTKLSLKRAPQVPYVPPSTVGAPPVPGAPGPTPANIAGAPVDAQRIQQIQEEISRRRALRQQALQQQQNAAPSGPVPIPGSAPSLPPGAPAPSVNRIPR